MMHTRGPFLFSPWKTMCYTQRLRQLKIKSKLFPLSLNLAIESSRVSFFSPHKNTEQPPNFLKPPGWNLAIKKFEKKQKI